MARYNTVAQTTTATTTSTISVPSQGLFTQFTGTAPYTVTIPDPTVYYGQTQTFYNATSGIITISSPSGVFKGASSSGLSTQTVAANATISLASDGTNYVITSENGGPLVATTGTFNSTLTANSAVTITPASGTVQINPTTTGTIDNMAIGGSVKAAGGFTTGTFTSSISATSGTFTSTLSAVSATLTSATLGSNLGDLQLNTRLATNNGNGSTFDIFQLRDSAGSTWSTAGTRFQQKIDSTWMGYMQFNGTNFNGGISWGTGTTTVSPQAITEQMRLDSSGILKVLSNVASTTTSTGSVVITGGLGVSGQITATTFVETSSLVFKENINPITGALDKVLQLVGVTYDRKDNKKHEAGLIAEDVFKILPELVSKDENGNPHGIQYAKLTAYLIESIKALKEEINEMKK